MDKNLQSIGKNIGQFLWKYHFTLFFVIAVSGITLAIYSLLDVINTTTPATVSTSTDSAATFDDATIKRIDELKSGSEQGSFSLPTNQRTELFMEG